MTRRLAALLLVPTLALTACGGPDARALVDGASERLEEAGTSRFEVEVRAAGSDVDRFAAEGAQDLTSGALRMAIDLGDPSSDTETLLLGREVFVRSPLFAMFTGDASVWVRVDLEATAEAEGLDADALLGGQAGPAALLSQLSGASGGVEELGGEEVRRVETTHLRVTIDAAAAIEGSDPAVREQLRAYAEETGLPDTYPMELWIDDDGLVRRIRTTLDVPDLARGGTPVTQQTTLELYDFGLDVDLGAPLAAETVELSDLIARFEELDRREGELTDEAELADEAG